MSRDKAHSAPAIPEHVRPLPAKPNLEFERKRAKQMLRSINDGDRDALDRVRRYRSDIAAADVKLSDVQLTIAREYGFSSWPKLVSYYETFERHDRAGPRFQNPGRDHLEHRVESVMMRHGRGHRSVLGELSAFVPRLYGRTDSEIFATAITKAEAQLVVARTERFTSWEAIMEHAEEPREWSVEADRESAARYLARLGSPTIEALDAIRRRDIEALGRLIDAHPELVETPSAQRPGESLLHTVLLAEQERPSQILTEQKKRSSEIQAIESFLISRGADLRATLSRMLLFGIHRKPEEVAYLLERGADPNWLPPDGVPILEHALINYWNPAAVDLIAQRVTPRKAFWIAAGLGDVPTMLSFLDKDGKPTAAARANRPDFTLVGFNSPCRPDADDLEIIWEAFCIAGFNQRLNSLDALLDRGFPIDYSQWGSTLHSWAEGNGVNVVAEHLKKRGATP
jgi:hypothetical protein